MLNLGRVCSSEKENRKEIYQNISVYNSSKKIGSKEMKIYIFSDLSPWLKLNPSSKISYNNDNLCNAIYVMHITYHLVPQYLCDMGSNSHLSKTWHFLTCLDYLIWCWYSQGSLPCNSSSNKYQSTSSSSNTLSCVPSTKSCACLFLLQNPIQTQEKMIVPLQEGRDLCGQQALWQNPSQRVLHHLKYATDTSLFTFWGVPAGRYTLDCSLAPLY